VGRIDSLSGAKRPGANRSGAKRPGANRPGAKRPGTDSFTQLRIIEHCTSNDRVKINSKKTKILQINKKNKELNLTLFDENIIEEQNIKHLGLKRQKHNRQNIESRTSTERATMYSLMGAGLHGINGINPLISYKLWKTFCPM